MAAPYSLHVGAHSLQIAELTDTHHHGTTVWPAGETLCFYFRDLAAKSINGLAGKRVLELGSGTGILAIYLALLGAAVVATDQDVPVILDNLRANVDRNRPSALTGTGATSYDIIIAAHNWGTTPGPALDRLARLPASSWASGIDNDLSTAGLQSMPWDYIIAADCIYTLEPLPLLLQSIDCLVGSGPSKTVVLVAMERRDPLVSDQFVGQSKALDFVVAKVPRSKLNKDVAHESMEVYKLTRRAGKRATATI
ncbi:hypothetical protein AMAG_01854 [Allomyces macrogynus ATCC 38327]|uniref:Uncharacterized protein n=1 Tax=Allomyces macrogynus (strain ATCC 38327) TaxID=578462 RepID=A0A0L0S0U3_ALLM3|nr:hypothetical protein AMAG_01854 [Allomyces macrogynus ATCC 38327]|eukprot:KNE56010.1 hypothetical protein AMAG_01854 [Allomyces macrogynus ATCC 38327]